MGGQADSSGPLPAFGCRREGPQTGGRRVPAKGWQGSRNGSALGRIIEGLFEIDQCEGRPVPETGRDKPGAMGSDIQNFFIIIIYYYYLFVMCKKKKKEKNQNEPTR